MRVLIDTNIVLDILEKRDPFMKHLIRYCLFAHPKRSTDVLPCAPFQMATLYKY